MINYKNIKGITLIALVITVIILLILAGITLNVTIGENGLITKAQQAAKEQEITNLKETMDFEALSAQMDAIITGANPLDIFLSSIQEEIGSINVDREENSNKAYIEKNGHTFIAENIDGKIQLRYIGETSKLPPEITKSLEITNTTNSITVKVSARLAEKYRYYIKTNETGEWGSYQESSSNEYTFNGLSQDTIYYIKVEAINKNGQDAKEERRQTVLMPNAEEVLSVTNEEWNSEQLARVKITSTENGYTIQYTTNLDDESSWKEVENGAYTEYELIGGTTVYVRLNDGINTTNNIQYAINRQETLLTLAENSGTVTYPNTKEVTITNPGGGNLSASSSDTSKATATTNGNKLVITPIAVGTSTITVTAAATNRYNMAHATYSATVELGVLTVTYYKNDGTNTTQTGTIYDSIESDLSTNVFSRNKYEFVKWNTEANGSGTDYTNKITANSNIDLYAQWRKLDSTPPTVTITMENSTDYLFAIKSTVSITDSSGVDFSNCKYIYTTSSDEIGDNISSYTEGSLTQENTTIEKAKTTGTYYLHVIAKDNEGNIGETVSDSGISITGDKTYGCTSSVETANLLPGTYKFDVYGAQGGGSGGKGGYSYGTYNISSAKVIYICVGGTGGQYAGGYNGGGSGGNTGIFTTSFGGGGASHIATELRDTGILNKYASYTSDILIVAGGGGGQGGPGTWGTPTAGGNAGGTSGLSGGGYSGGGGTQSTGGAGGVNSESFTQSQINSANDGKNYWHTGARRRPEAAVGTAGGGGASGKSSGSGAVNGGAGSFGTGGAGGVGPQWQKCKYCSSGSGGGGGSGYVRTSSLTSAGTAEDTHTGAGSITITIQ